MTTIVLVDDHQIVRQGLRALLENESDFDIVGESGSGQDGLALVARTQPDILIVDLMLPDLNGLEVTRRVAQQSPKTRVVVLSMRSVESYVLEALNLGAYAYVLKMSSAEDLVYAVRETLAGRHYLSPPLSERAIMSYATTAALSSSDVSETLTNREREILQMAAEGLSSAEIAKRLSISPRTAELHRGNMMNKLGLKNQTELIRYAFKRGILTLDN